MVNKKEINKSFTEIGLLEKYYESKPIALAVSGGPDSTALMFLVSKSKKLKKIM